MNTALLWFSGTGNSLHAAKRLADGLEGDCELSPLSRTAEDPPVEADRVGLVFPVYAWGPPNIVLRRLRAGLPLAGDPEVFAVATCAGSAGGTLVAVRRQLSRHQRQLAGGLVVRMPESYLPMGGREEAPKRESILRQADRRIDEIAADVNAGRWRVHESNLFVRGLSRMVNRLARGHWPRADKNFSVDDTCVKCGRCAAICPVGDVELVAGRPTWLGKCEQCFACLHWCPVSAIQYGKKSRSQPRYTHPGVDVDEMLAAGVPAPAGPEQPEE